MGADDASVPPSPEETPPDDRLIELRLEELRERLGLDGTHLSLLAITRRRIFLNVRRPGLISTGGEAVGRDRSTGRCNRRQRNGRGCPPRFWNWRLKPTARRPFHYPDQSLVGVLGVPDTVAGEGGVCAALARSVDTSHSRHTVAFG